MRLTLTLFLWFVVAAYLIMRGAIEDEAMRARYSAVLGVLAALLIPFIHLSVYLFQARLHPMPVVLKPGEPSMPGDMLETFLLGFLVFTVLCIAFIRMRYRVAVLRELAEVHDD
jgi:heme exporter protein C